MFVGDSLSSNQWQSLTCMVQSAVPGSNYTLVQRKSFYSLTFPVCLLWGCLDGIRERESESGNHSIPQNG